MTALDQMDLAQVTKFRLGYLAQAKELDLGPVTAATILPVYQEAELLLARLVLQDGIGAKEVEELRIGLDALRGIYQKLNQETL